MPLPADKNQNENCWSPASSVTHPSDPSAIGSADALVLSVGASTGTIAMTDASGNPVPEPGTGLITISGSIEQLNADLATLSYTADSTGGSAAAIALIAVDQAGMTGTGVIGITVDGSNSTGFDGDIVTLDIYDPSIANNNVIGAGTATVGANTTTFASLAALQTATASVAPIDGSLTLNGDTITFIYSASEEGATFASGTFNGYVLNDLAAHAGNILGVTLNGTNINGLTASDLGFTPTSVELNMAGLTLPTNEQGILQIGVQFANDPVSTASLIAHSSA